MDSFFEKEVRYRRRLKVLDRDAWFTWTRKEDPTDKDMKAMQALVDAAMEMESGDMPSDG